MYQDKDLTGTKADGILGMTPKVSSSRYEQLFVQRLYEEKLIASNMFGVNYRYTTGTSKIILGGFDETVVTNSSLFSYVKLKDTTYWSLNLVDMTYGSDTIGITATRAILDTGTSLTYWATADFNTVYSKITSGKTCGYSSASGFRACQCTSDTDFKDISFHLGDYRYYFPASSWIFVRTSGSSTI